MDKQARIDELEAAIREHASQRLDDRCFLDDLKLYKLVGIDEHPGLALPKEEFLSNCSRYYDCQQTYKTREKEYWEEVSRFQPEGRVISVTLESIFADSQFKEAIVKWDGCINVFFKESTDSMHICDMEYFIKQMQELEDVYKEIGE